MPILICVWWTLCNALWVIFVQILFFVLHAFEGFILRLGCYMLFINLMFNTEMLFLAMHYVNKRWWYLWVIVKHIYEWFCERFLVIFVSDFLWYLWVIFARNFKGYLWLIFDDICEWFLIIFVSDFYVAVSSKFYKLLLHKLLIMYIYNLKACFSILLVMWKLCFCT